jgi:hypothetical protein
VIRQSALPVADSGLTTVQRSVHEEGTRQVQRIASYPKITVTEGGRGVCAATFKRGFGYHPLLAWLDNTREALAGMLRPGNANANTAADHITVTDEALAQIHEHRCGTPILICADGDPWRTGPQAESAVAIYPPEHDPGPVARA